jgi:glycosyltransferase involved in cell wall biosynthesis
MKANNLVVGIYYHPEAYPPTLNAVGELSPCFQKVSIVHRPNLKGAWKYPFNVTAIPSGKYISSSGQEQASTLRKIGFFLRFVMDLLSACLRLKPAVILLYDANALLAYRLVRPFLFFRHILWYHNHDIAEIATLRKFSVGWFACRGEKKMFTRIDLFTLPSSERLAYFPMSGFKGKYFVVPNYPSLKFYGPFFNPNRFFDQTKLIFQGRIGPGHGLEEIIPLLSRCPSGKPVELVLKGHCKPEYKEALLSLAAAHGVESRVSFLGFTAYEEVPRAAAGCQIGIAIFSAKEVMHVTLGTASNKIYEYAALGLPVIYLNEDHFSRYLHRFPWAFGIELSTESLETGIGAILSDYVYFSEAAHESFLSELNFEQSFKPVLEEIADLLAEMKSEEK